MNIEKKLNLIRKELKEYFRLAARYGYKLCEEKKDNFFHCFLLCRNDSDLKIEITFSQTKNKDSFGCNILRGEKYIMVSKYIREVLKIENDSPQIDPYLLNSFNETSIRTYLDLLSKVLESHMSKILKGEEWIDIPFDMRLLDEYR